MMIVHPDGWVQCKEKFHGVQDIARTRWRSPKEIEVVLLRFHKDFYQTLDPAVVFAKHRKMFDDIATWWQYLSQFSRYVTEYRGEERGVYVDPDDWNTEYNHYIEGEWANRPFAYKKIYGKIKIVDDYIEVKSKDFVFGYAQLQLISQFYLPATKEMIYFNNHYVYVEALEGGVVMEEKRFAWNNSCIFSYNFDEIANFVPKHRY